MKKTDKTSNVIILGSGRSGTSILGELFEHLPDYEYLFEVSLDSIAEEIGNNPNRKIAIKVPKSERSLTPGLACNIDELVEILGNNYKIIWIVRNPLDTICSLKPGIEDNWNHNPKPPNYKELLKEPWHIKCAHHWGYINNIGFNSAKRYRVPLIVRYEDLLNNTKFTISKILKFINTPTSIEELDNYINLISDKTENSYHAKFQEKWYRENHKTRINRYKENMTEIEIKESLDIVRDTMQQFGYSYDLEEDKNTYSDGDDVENQILEFFKEEKSFDDINEFIKDNPSWPIKYHLSSDRHNLLSWYRFEKDSSLLEIGAGCGSITGLLLDKGLDVTAVELTERRADIIKNRFKDRKNLEVLDGNIYNKDFKKKYDYVTSIGVLEYSGKYIDSDTPFLDFLKTAKGFLKENGLLIVAIENRFGLKYWRGAPEDHTNVLFDSLEGYPNYDGIRTFGKNELTNLFIDTGFKKDSISFYYPLPDYKFCYEVFSDRYLPSDEHPLSHGIYPSPHPTQNYNLFDERLVANGLQENNLFEEFANSFLVFIKNE